MFRNLPLAERGVAMIEFAFASGIMVVMVLGILAYGEVLATYVQLKYAVGELSRQVAMGDDLTDRQARYAAAITQVNSSYGFSSGCAVFAPSPFQGEVTITGRYYLDREGCRTMPSLMLPMPSELVAHNKFSVP
ncbi:hypothetical protein DKG75_10465 [Zavarzinia compransoris]|uniref:TadE-like domain-containing protein n=1 Tax=Zavarzinia compransoris TaxID=1264899 RepID=A0A317E7V3_9PROT|nr:hypothetical protein DKG75_10465 [Zavarzinia compransoris]